MQAVLEERERRGRELTPAEVALIVRQLAERDKRVRAWLTGKRLKLVVRLTVNW